MATFRLCNLLCVCIVLFRAMIPHSPHFVLCSLLSWHRTMSKRKGGAGSEQKGDKKSRKDGKDSKDSKDRESKEKDEKSKFESCVLVTGANHLPKAQWADKSYTVRVAAKSARGYGQPEVSAFFQDAIFLQGGYYYWRFVFSCFSVFF